MPKKCCVVNCSEPVVAKDLCRKHYMRVQRTGEVDGTRPNDWGKREKHPVYKAWCGLRRYHLNDSSSDWANDFWKFAEDIPNKPENSKASRKDSLFPWSKDNFYWKEFTLNSEDEKLYARERRKQARVANPDYYADSDLRRKYGVTLEWYRKKLSDQNGACAICFKLETVKIKGKLIAMPVDHDHATGKPRGLLCTKCNRALGLFLDDPKILQSAIKYLQT